MGPEAASTSYGSHDVAPTNRGDVTVKCNSADTWPRSIQSRLRELGDSSIDQRANVGWQPSRYIFRLSRRGPARAASAPRPERAHHDAT